MRMRGAPLVAAMVVVGLTAGIADAGTIVVVKDETGNDAYSSDNGGEYKVVTFTGASVPALGSDVKIGNGLFQTFCIERSESIAQNTTYDWVLNTEAVNGGFGGGNPDPLDARTAYLFTQFWNGSLNNYDFTPLGDGVDERKLSAAALQDAIWYIEGEISSVSGQAQTWVNEANTAVASGGVWEGKGLGNVRVLNLTETLSNGSVVNRQDLLVMVPLPPAAYGGLMLLGGLALVGRLRRRRLRLAHRA